MRGTSIVVGMGFGRDVAIEAKTSLNPANYATSGMAGELGKSVFWQHRFSQELSDNGAALLKRLMADTLPLLCDFQRQAAPHRVDWKKPPPAVW